MTDEATPVGSVLDHVLRVQRAIAERTPFGSVLDAICSSAADLIPSSTVAFRLMDPEHPTGPLLSVPGAGMSGRPDALGPEPIAAADRLAVRAVVEGRPVVADDAPSLADAGVAGDGVAALIASPVRRNGAPVGALVVVLGHTDRPVGARPVGVVERLVAESMAELATLAFNDASAIEVIQHSLERAIFDSRHDQLTGLANRSQAIDRLEQWAADDSGTTVIFIDLDRFKSINDAYGHNTGDEILRLVARRLEEATRVDDMVARLSGDEFLVIARSPDEDTAVEVASRIADTLRFTATVGIREIRVSASVGCARHIRGETADEVIANADLAMYRAKGVGGGQLVRYDGPMREARTAELALERELRFAVDHGEFEVYFQPVLDLVSERLIGAEALVRWHHPARGLLAPGTFIDAAEAAGIIGDIDTLVLRLALDHVARWHHDGRLDPDFRISVNMSARKFHGSALVDSVAAQLDDGGVGAGRLWLEITETAMMGDVDTSLATMHALRRLGVHLSVDDFGTGWSSLAYLKQFPVQALKIDQSFVAGLCTNADDHAIVEATIRLAGALGLGVIAEGVETGEQAAELRRLGCASVQGFHYARPLPAPAFAAQWLARDAQ